MEFYPNDGESLHAKDGIDSYSFEDFYYDTFDKNLKEWLLRYDERRPNKF